MYLPEDLARELDECMRITGIKNRSRIIREALRLFIAEHRWKAVGKASGIKGLYMIMKLKVLMQRLQIFSMNTSIYMLTIIVRVDTGRIKELLNNIMNIKRVLITRPMLL
ncbi:CopG family ribbon-helix-helix protein [Staphylothermus hellenicus]|uniref:Putative transcriptional regulator, CopG family n=1 Tax=Staphylothermus hellenicus (strain DSM 12710 / JCM 10830 / BK20S6-10-b1 / P8) TaxID=591019 RepID=D7D812_STAHD|nr:ribbon-helix-helix protein, CopG family [Staphylothermus hellenicus]ADI31908.1 putative transcriptional regulator, CopG family [Staphylothermus hellenicus DSM 12710]